MRYISVVLLAATAVWAQSDLSTIRGVATDQSGAVVPAIKITLTDVERNTVRSGVTGSDGAYEIPFLVPGTYKLVGAGPGFKEFVAEQIRLTSRETRRIDMTFELGQVGTSVSVTADAAVISTEGAQVASGFNKQNFVDSPLSQSFFPQAYMTTLPNVQTNMGGWGLRMAGQGPTQMAESMDGVISDGAVNLVQNMFDFEELQVVPVNNSAEFSRVANFTLTGRGGTNQFHGRIYYDLINSALNARNTFVPFKPSTKEHTAAAAVNGPIIRNKTFFYGSYSLRRLPSKNFNNRNVPTVAMRGGDFSALTATVRDPLTMQNGNPATATPFPGNRIPAGRINPTAKLIQDNYVPSPNQGGPNERNSNYGFLHPWAVDLFKWDSVTARIDHHFSEKNTVFGRFINRLTPYVLAGAFPQVGTWTRARDHHSIVVSDTHVFSPTVVNTFRWGWIKDYFFDGDTIDGYTPVKGDDVVKAIGLQGVNPSGYSAMGFPVINITGITLMRVNPGGTAQDINIHSFGNTTSWSKGSHVIKFGGEIRSFRDFVDVVAENTYGNFSFSGQMAGEGYAEFLLGMPTQSQRLDPLRNRLRRTYELGFYLTDTWKATRRLTLDYGVRWDYFRSPYYADNMMYNWDPGTGDVTVPQGMLNSISPLYPTNLIRVREGDVLPSPAKNNFRLRIGAAYRIADSFVVRGGYGQYTESLGPYARVNSAPGPYRIADTYINLDEFRAGRSPVTFPNPFPGRLGAVASSQSIQGFPLDTDNGVIHQFNVSIEKEVHRLGLRGSYIGSRSSGLNYDLATNKPRPSLTPFNQNRRPFSQFVNTTYSLADGRSNYDSVQFEANRKWGSFTFIAHYTLSNAMSDWLNLQDPYDHYFWNRDQFNSRHRAVFNTIWDLPFGKGRRWMSSPNRAAQFVLGGWQTQTVHYFQSGQYFSPSFSAADPSNTNTIGGLPDRIADGNLPADQRQVQRWFDASAFAVPPAGRYGNSGVNTLEGPGWNLHHLTVVKQFNVTDRWKVLFQGNIADIFNTPHYNFPMTNISVPLQVARLFQAQDGGNSRERGSQREITFRLRIEF